MIPKAIHRAASRGFADYGGLQSYRSFPFGEFQDAAQVPFGALCVLNDDVLPPGGGVGAHPHENREMLWLMLEGELSHRDDFGNRQTLRAGEAQLLSAGSGVWHTEKNEGAKAARALQIWLMPDELNTLPRYEKRSFQSPNDEWEAIAAPIDRAREGAIGWRQIAWLSRAKLTSGTGLEYEVKAYGNGLYLFVIEGAVVVEDEILTRRDAMELRAGCIALRAKSTADVLVFDVPGVGA